VTDVRPVGPWQRATVIAVHAENARVKTFRLSLPNPQPFMAGQHFVVRLTADDGYTAQRSYSVANPPGDGSSIELTIERLEDGEVSTYLHDELAVGDEVEVRGPIGGWFVWDGASPALLIGGGSGVVPLMSMLRLARATGAVAHLVVSHRTPDDAIYADELVGDDVTVIYTRVRPVGRMTVDDLRPRLQPEATVFICGSAPFANAATELVMALDVVADRIRIERFGPTG
jgi:ferredoxin-NADP reductase